MTSQPFAIPALLLFVAALPLVFGLIPRNRFYGVRTLKTLSADTIWYAANRLAAIVIMIGSSVYGVVAFLFPYDRTTVDNLPNWGLHLAAFVLPILIGFSLVIRYIKRL